MAERKIHAILDVETIGNGVVFDIAWSICNNQGIIETKNFLIKEVYNYQKISEFQFHGAKKANLYNQMVQDGKVEIVPWREAILTLWEDLDLYRVFAIWAYNVVFDIGAIAYTNKLIRHKEFKLFENYQILDLYTAFCMQVGKRKDYKKFCKQFEFVSPAGNIQTKAETAIRFIRNTPEYSELHTAGQDTVDEFEIFQWIRKTKKKRNCPAIPNPWKMAQ